MKEKHIHWLFESYYKDRAEFIEPTLDDAKTRRNELMATLGIEKYYEGGKVPNAMFYNFKEMRDCVGNCVTPREVVLNRGGVEIDTSGIFP